ncbi:MAG: hypothetical protein WC601_06070 [Desulfotomaculaceae bacterium]
MAFEIYKPRGEKIKKELIISLSKNSIVLNKHAREKLQAQKIELAYDKDTNTIRIKATDDGQTLKKTKTFAKGFFNQFGIAKKGKFTGIYDEIEKALFVDIS